MHEEAKRDYLKVIELDPNLHAAYHNIAITLLELNDAQNALNNINKFLQCHPQNQSALNVKKEVELKLAASSSPKITQMTGSKNTNIRGNYHQSYY